MENNEIMNYEEGTEMMEEVVADSKPGLSTGGKLLVGTGVFLAITAGYKLVKKAWAARKAKKELHQPDYDVYVDEEDVEEVATK